MTLPSSPNGLTPRFSKRPGIVSPGTARTTSTPWTPGTAFSRAASGAAGAAGPGFAVPDRAPGALPWPTAFDADICAVSTCDSAMLPNLVGSLASCVVIAIVATVVTSSASTRPLTERNAARGSSPMRRAAISVPGRLVHRAMSRAAAMVSHGPAMNSPMMISAKLVANAWICPWIEAGCPCAAQKPSSARPRSRGTTCQTPGGFGVTRRVTPSGEMFTRRSASRAATAAAAGTPAATTMTSLALSVSWPGKNGWPTNGMPATGMRSPKKTANPAATPATAAAVDSTAASADTCVRVAPARRIAANRSSRRAADSRVAVPMKIRTGSRIASATTDKIRSVPLAGMPVSAGTYLSPLGL